MKQKVLDYSKKSLAYTVVIEKEQRTGTKNACYSAYVPLLGIGTEADTIEKAQEEIKKLVEFHLESLTEEGQEIPVEKGSSIITKLSALLPKNAQIAAN